MYLARVVGAACPVARRSAAVAAAADRSESLWLGELQTQPSCEAAAAAARRAAAVTDLQCLAPLLSHESGLGRSQAEDLA